MAISTAAGVVDTDAIASAEKVVDMQNKFRMLDVDQAQFMTILNKLPSQEAKSEKVNWLEDQFFPNLTALAASASSADTNFTVTSGEGAYLRVGDLVKIGFTGELVEVSATAANSFTATRSIGDVAAASAQTGSDLVIVSNAEEQGSDYGELKVTNRVHGYNYTQIIRHPFGLTNTQKEIETYGPDYLANETAKKALEHKRSLDNLLFLGGRAYDTSASKGWMGGLTEFISTNVTSSVGTLSLSALDDALQDIFQHGSMEKVIFAAPTPAAALSRLLANNWVRARPDDRVYGAKVNAFINGAYGASVPVITMRAWGRESTASNQRGGWMVVVDLSNVRKRPLRNRGTRLLRNRQGNGVDSVIHEYLTEMSFEVAQEKTHGILKGITG